MANSPPGFDKLIWKYVLSTTTRQFSHKDIRYVNTCLKNIDTKKSVGRQTQDDQIWTGVGREANRASQDRAAWPTRWSCFPENHQTGLIHVIELNTSLSTLPWQVGDTIVCSFGSQIRLVRIYIFNCTIWKPYQIIQHIFLSQVRFPMLADKVDWRGILWLWSNQSWLWT